MYAEFSSKKKMTRVIASLKVTCCVIIISIFAIGLESKWASLGTLLSFDSSKDVHNESKNVFVTLVAGMNPANTEPLSSRKSYLGYLLHLSVVRFVLDMVGSSSDVIVLVRLEKELNLTMLPKAQETFFEKLRMKLEYLAPENNANNSNYMMDKFHILRLHGYKRTLFFDADVLPICNWDYYFGLMDEGFFAPNLVVAYKNEPAQGGFFIFTPEIGDWDVYRKLRFIDDENGFGARLQHPAETLKHNFSTWTWFAASSDQGLIYHWARYVKKNATIIKGDHLQNWEGTMDGEQKLVKDLQSVNLSCPNHIQVPPTNIYLHYPVLNDHLHYTGSKKAWQRTSFDPNLLNEINLAPLDRFSLWSLYLHKAWKKYDLGSLYSLFPFENGTALEDIHKLQRFLTTEPGTNDSKNN
jgi:hypothetical protein